MFTPDDEVHGKAAFDGDMFFPLEDCRADVEAIPAGELRVIPTPVGHLREADTAAIDAVIAETLAA